MECRRQSAGALRFREKPYQRSELRLRLPSEAFARAGGISPAVLNVRGSEERRLDGDVLAMIEAERCESWGRELFALVTLAGRHDVVGGLILLQHPPHRVNVFGRVAPVSRCGEISEVQ